MERLIGTVRREFLDRLLFWDGRDLSRKLELFRHYFIMNTEFIDPWRERRPPKRAEVQASRQRALAITAGRVIARSYLNCLSLPKP